MKSLQHEIILASAGSGKTYQLTNRFIALLARGVPPEQIVALTFTRKAAGEFLDAILEKLAGAASDPGTAASLGGDIGLPEHSCADFTGLLRTVLRSAHRLCLTTLDSFFIRIARSLPLELGLGGDLQMLGSGSRVETARREVFDAVFRKLQEDPDIFHAFLFALKESSYGKEDLRILPIVDGFVDEHHETVLRAPDATYWGDEATIWPEGSGLAGKTIADFHAALDRLEKAFSSETFTAASQKKVEEFFPQARAWTYGSKVPSPMSSIIGNIVAAVPDLARGNAIISIGGKKIEFDGLLAEIGLATAQAFAGIEIASKLKRTRALYFVLANYELKHDALLRKRGKLAFDDLVVVLRRALRETDGIASDLAYRLDSKYDHWLLDEFQDTSRRQWDVLRPLVDEVILDGAGDRSYFQVGDTKQSIYAWRGGDPTLIHDIREQYGDLMHERSLARSFRSVPAVLECVNAVFGNANALKEIVPEASIAQLEWAEHEASPHTAGGTGFACLIHPEGKAPTVEDVYDLALETVRKIQPLERGLTCAIICEKNDTVAAIADHFRASGFSAVVNGSRVEPATDNPVTLPVLALFRLAAFPGDTFARGVVEMSPLARVIGEEFRSLDDAGTAVLAQIADEGFADAVDFWTLKIEQHGALGEENAFARHRLQGLAEIARTYDDEPDRSVAGFLDFAEDFKSAEVPGAGVIQVMTLHASKGLGFDMVILPELEGKSLLELRGGLAIGGEPGRPEWVLDMPKEAIALADPVLAKKFAQQKADAGFESLCKFYVAMTRAKRGLYMVSRRRGTSKANNVLRVVSETLGEDYECGDRDWFREVELSDKTPVEPVEESRESIELGPRPVLRAETGSTRTTFASSAALAHGNAEHERLSKIEWQKEGEAISPAFVRPEGDVVLWREKAFECAINGKWVSGVFDRVVIENDAKRVVVYDFKTGSAAGAERQLGLYKRVLEQMFSGYAIETRVEAI